MQTTITSKGQVTIPRDVRQQFGLKQGMAVTFAVEGDHIALRPAAALRQPGASGFGLIPRRPPAFAPDFDVPPLVASEP